MFANNTLYYLWRNDFSLAGRKIVRAMLFRTFVEYCGFFILLLHHRAIAEHIFRHNDWYHSTVYFELVLAGVVLVGVVLFLGLWKVNFKLEPNSGLAKLVYYAQPCYLSFFALGLHFLESTAVSISMLFGLVSFVYSLCYALEKLISIQSLMRVVVNKAAYSLVAQLYFLALVAGMIFASFMNKISTLEHMHHFSRLTTLIYPLLTLSFLSGVFEHRIAKYKGNLTKTQQQILFKHFCNHSGELLLKLGVNLLVGAFLVKWYFFMPMFLQFAIHWDQDQIASILFIASLLGLGVNLLVVRCFGQLPLHLVFYSFMTAMMVLMAVVAWNLFHYQWIAFSILTMAIFYNSIQTIANKIIHHEIIELEINVLFLVIGNALSIIFFGFFSSGISVILVYHLGVNSQVLASSILLFSVYIFAMICYFCLRKLKMP